MEVSAEKSVSAGYRCLFELVKEEGIEPVMNFALDVMKIPSRADLIKQATMYGKNDLLALVKRNQDIIKYVREHKEEFSSINFGNEYLIQTLSELSNNITLLTTYLENARKLEDLKITRIHLNDDLNFFAYQCVILRNKETKKIIYIEKYYTDAVIMPAIETPIKDTVRCHCSVIPIININDNNATFVLRALNAGGTQSRSIHIKNFGFDNTKLPTEEELQSYEIPKSYVLK